MLKLYKYITAALAFAGSLSLLITGELNLVFILPGVMMVPGYYRYVNDKPPVSRWLIAGLAAFEVFVLAFDVFFVSSDFLIAIAHMTIIFQALKSFDMREPWDPLQVYFMSILQIIITSELSLSILVGGVFAVFLVLFMAAMVFSHFMKEGTLQKVSFFRPTLVISLTALFLTVIFFISIPRVSGGLWGRKASTGLRSVGFSENVDLGSYGRVLDDPSIVLRAELEGEKLPLYWRGTTLDQFDGVRWSKTFQARSRVFKQGGRFTIKSITFQDSSALSKQRVVVEPLDTNVIFGLGEVLAVEAKGWFLYKNNAGAVFLSGKDNRRVSYTTTSLRDMGNREVFKANKYLSIPEGMEKIKQLAGNLTARITDDIKKAEAILAHLESNYQYTLSPRPPTDDSQPIQWFLFNSREGYCEHFATAMALMLRAEDIPSRIVTGFMGGEADETGNYIIVRQRNAHSWVEAGIDGRWVRFDPTPVSLPVVTSKFFLTLDNLRMKWYRYVIGFSRYDQISMLSSLTLPVFETPDIGGLSLSISPLYLLGLVAFVATLIFFMRRGSSMKKTLSYSTKAYMVFRDKLRKRGGRVYDSSTPEEVAGEAIRLKADPEKVFAFTALYIAQRFGSENLSTKEKELLKLLSKRTFK